MKFTIKMIPTKSQFLKPRSDLRIRYFTFIFGGLYFFLIDA